MSSINTARENHAANLLKRHNLDYALIKRPKEKLYIDKAFSLLTHGDFNYYHFLIELLPKLDLFIKQNKHHECNNIIVSQRCFSVKSMFTLINYVIGDAKINIIPVDDRNQYSVKMLYSITNINYVLFSSKDNTAFMTDCFFRFKVLEHLKNHIINAVTLTHNTRKVFLARKQTLVRKYNQDEVIALVQQFGFDVVYPEDCSIEEQISLFYSAKFIIGASGAAWANIIFCQSNTKMISWYPFGYESTAIFSTLAKMNENTLWSVKIHSMEDETYIHSDYTIDVNDLKDTITKLMASI